jgi:beta-fructofuranosidase
MLYRPPDGVLWDTFLMRDEGWFHLFHLRDGKSLGHARSRDLLHWQVRPAVDLTGPAGAWNDKGAPWTGCIVRHEGRFHMLAGGPGPDGIPGYGLLVSDDLDHWEQLSWEPVLVPQPPHYLREPSDLHLMHAAWRDPCVIRHGGWYHAFLCGRSPEWSADDTGALVAHLRSRDLEHWEHLPPLTHVGGRALFTEVPDVFRLGEWWYLLFLDHGWGGTRINSPARSDMAGTFYMKSPSLEGPYEWPEEPLLIGGDDDRMGPWAARTLAVDQERWLYFHHAGGQPAFGLPKRIEQADDGDLWLSYLPLTEPIEEELALDPAAAAARAKPQDRGRWSESNGTIVGRAEATGTAVVLADDVLDARLTCQIRGEGAARAGVVLRSVGAAGTDLFEQDNRGLVVWLDFERGRLVAERGAWVPGFGWGRFVLDQMGHDETRRSVQHVRRALPRERWLGLRVMLRDRFLEAYVDERWMLTLDTGDHAQAGRVELTVERGEARFRALSLASLPPLSAAVEEGERPA